MLEKALSKTFYTCLALGMLLLYSPSKAQVEEDKKEKSSTIELIGADFTEFDIDIVDAERVIGNVRFKQDNMFMDCDSAYFYRQENKIEAFGNIYIRQKDTLNLWGDYLEYNGDTKKALVKGNVRLKDKKMSLKTDVLRYDMETKTAYYTTGGHMTNGEDHLYSRIGHFYSRSKNFHFKDSVRLINPEYTMDSDTLHYNTDTKIAEFVGPTYIRSEENTIFCRYGWYNTNRNMSQFSRGAYIEGKENRLVADSMTYNRNTGIGQAFRNIVLIDTVEDIKILGEYGRYDRSNKKTVITGMPMTVIYTEDDSMFVMSDTMIDQTDTISDRRVLRSFPNSSVYRSDLQGHSDSLVYSFTDSTISMYYNPVLWSDSNQITGDTLVMHLKRQKIDRMDVRSNSFIAGLDGPNRYNQIQGKNMEARFRGGKIDKIYVKGNGKSIYYAKEDSNTYTGVNDIVCNEMLIRIDSNKVRVISFYNKPEGAIYPLDDFPASKRYLPGFIWREDEKPKLAQFEARYTGIVSQQSKGYKETIQQETALPKTDYPPMEEDKPSPH